MSRITALIADDEEAPREQLRAALQQAWPGLEIVAVGSMARLTAPDTEGGENGTTARSRLTAWSVPGTESAQSVWPMWGGAATRAFQAPSGGEEPKPTWDSRPDTRRRTP